MRGEATMSETQVLLHKIAALRQQLEQVQGLAQDAGSAAASLVMDRADDTNRVRRLERQVAAGTRHAALLDTTLRQLSPPAASEPPLLPRQLTSRARRILEQGRGLLAQLRALADSFDASSLIEKGDGDSLAGASGEGADPLTQRYQETAAMAETALRMVQAFPDAASAQTRLCEGLEAILGVVSERVSVLAAGVEHRRQEQRAVDTLAELLTQLYAAKPVGIQPFVELAEAILAEGQGGAPLRFLSADAKLPARFIASHSLTVARVAARVVWHAPDLRCDALDLVLAALLHDAAMLGVPVEILAATSPLDDDQRRAIEVHTRVGAEMMVRLLPSGPWLAQAAAGHHERLDGTGYPAGLRDLQISALSRLLAVCDVYAALCTPRPQRPARDTRTALADTLVLAEQGALDRLHAERLLLLSFYPVGSVVELADGAVGIVVATHMGRRDLNTPARPVVALLTDSQGHPLPAPRHVDLAQCEHRSIVRTLPGPERRELLGRRYPELV
jgi:HD-GYP domain-containing protein (c-di-GMP phosphodiesterase class II)